VILHRIYGATVLSLLGLTTLSFCISPASGQQGQPAQSQPAQSQPAQANAAPPSPSQQAPAPPPQQGQLPSYNRAAVEATDGRYVPPSGTIDGSSMKQFLNSGADINATQMEEASIPADNLMQMPASVNNKADYRAQQAAQAQAQGGPGQQQNPHKKKKQKHHTVFGAIAQPFVSTLNFMGFPVGLNDDVGIDASLSSDLPESVRKRDGAYNPNVAPGVEATTNKWFGQ
jgi:hypothetical protein